jgi:hypothetical protein
VRKSRQRKTIQGPSEAVKCGRLEPLTSLLKMADSISMPKQYKCFGNIISELRALIRSLRPSYDRSTSLSFASETMGHVSAFQLISLDC